MRSPRGRPADYSLPAPPRPVPPVPGAWPPHPVDPARPPPLAVRRCRRPYPQLANRRPVRRRAAPKAPRQLATSPPPASGLPRLSAVVVASWPTLPTGHSDASGSRRDTHRIPRPRPPCNARLGRRHSPAPLPPPTGSAPGRCADHSPCLRSMRDLSPPHTRQHIGTAHCNPENRKRRPPPTEAWRQRAPVRSPHVYLRLPTDPPTAPRAESCLQTYGCRNVVAGDRFDYGQVRARLQNWATSSCPINPRNGSWAVRALPARPPGTSLVASPVTAPVTADHMARAPTHHPCRSHLAPSPARHPCSTGEPRPLAPAGSPSHTRLVNWRVPARSDIAPSPARHHWSTGQLASACLPLPRACPAAHRRSTGQLAGPCLLPHRAFPRRSSLVNWGAPAFSHIAPTPAGQLASACPLSPPGCPCPSSLANWSTGVPRRTSHLAPAPAGDP